jgi:cell wall-associated NlpC family hydrolase
VKLLIDYAMSFLGVPYVYGGNNRFTGLDCSGFVQEVIKSGGVILPSDMSAQGLHDLFINAGCKRQAGALAFFGKGPKEISHVALMVDGYRIIEAAGGDRTTRDFDEFKRRGAMVRIRPLTHRTDLITVLWPGYAFIAKEM